MVSGDCKKICDAATKVGLARESLSRALSTPHVAEHLRQKVMRHLSIAAARAGATKVDLLDSDSEIARDRASSFVLGLAGIQPATTPSVSLNLEIRAGYIIDVSPEPGEGVDRLPAMPHNSPHLRTGSPAGPLRSRIRLEPAFSWRIFPKMEKSRARMLEVSVTPCPPRWEWEVTSDGEPIANGFEAGQVEAKFEGYNAMFLLLAAGWAP